MLRLLLKFWPNLQRSVANEETHCRPGNGLELSNDRLKGKNYHILDRGAGVISGYIDGIIYLLVGYISF